MKKNIILTVLIILVGCGLNIEYNPYIVKGDYQNLTSTHLAAISQTSNTSFFPFSIIVTADLHAYYHDANDGMKHMNKLSDAEFVLVAGDLTDLGILSEYERTHDYLSDLEVPYLTVIGNHDALSNGKSIYRSMYGPFNYSFIYNNVKFIMFNSVKEEFNNNEPDTAWLESQLQSANSYHHIVIMSHIPFNDPVYSEQTRSAFNSLVFNHNVSLVINGHNHNFSLFQKPTLDGGSSLHLTTGSIDKRYFNKISFNSSSVSIERYYF